MLRNLLRLFTRQRAHEQIDKELRFHLDQYTADLIARGQSPDQAARQARLAFGGLQQVKEECRDTLPARWLDDLLRDLRYTLRTLRLHPSFAAVALCTLALGIGAATVMFTIVNSVLLQPLSFPHPERLVAIDGGTERYGHRQGMSYPDFLDLVNASRSFVMAAWSYGRATVSAPGDAEYVDGRQVSYQLFSVYGIPLVRGRAFLPEEDRFGAAPVAIISYRLWKRRFAGSPSAVGSALTYDGKSYSIVGIAPYGFQLDGDPDVFTPLGQVAEVRMRNRSATFLGTVARLSPGVTPAQAQADLSLIGRHLEEQYPAFNAGRTFEVRPLRDELVGNVGSTLWLLLGAVTLVTLIACVNVASLLLARAVSRERELAMRVALGAGRGRLIRQCLTESAVLGILGGALGVALAAIGVSPFVALWPGSLPRSEEIHLDWHVLLFALCASLACGLLFGLAPALRAPTRALEPTLRSGRHRLHGSFVISEIALAVVLLVAAGVLGCAMMRLSSVDPGFNAHNVLAAHVSLSPSALQSPAQTRAAWRDILDRARQVPGVQSSALSDIIPMRVGINSLGYWTTSSPPRPDQMPVALASGVTSDYLKVMGIPLRHGRFFDDRDRLETEPVIVIDEVLARHAFPNEDAVGKRLSVQAMGNALRVVGVVGHVRHWGLVDDDQSKIRDQVYYPFAQVPDPLMRLFSSFMSLTVRTTTPPLSMIEPLRHQLRGAAADQTLYDVHTMEQLSSGSLSRHRFLMMLFGAFAGLALFLACIGIYGVLAYVTSQRVPEIGLRMALGATADEVVWLVLGQSLRLILWGAGLGLAIALAATRILERQVSGVRSTEPATFAIMLAVLIVAALFASYLPARRAARVDPMIALRHN
jgi:predicted permease